MIIDCHTHMMKPVKSAGLLKAMDRVGVDKIMAISIQPPYKIWGRSNQAPPVKESIALLAELVKESDGRIIPFAWIDPVSETWKADIQLALEEYHFAGIKLIPTTWYPFDESIIPVYEFISHYQAPILFHSGILWLDGDCSRRCRPANYEIMMRFPTVKFALAHAGWPWTDECIAVTGKFHNLAQRGILPDKVQMFVDMTPGTPRVYRQELFERMSLIPEYQFEGKLMFGTDAFLEDYENIAAPILALDREIMDHKKFTKNFQGKYFSENFLKFIDSRKD